MKNDSTQEPQGEKGAKATLVFLIGVIALGLLMLLAKGIGLL